MNQKNQITSLNDLRGEIALLKNKISEHEINLQQRLASAPRRIVGTSLGAVGTFLLSKKLATSAWDIIQIASKVMLNKNPVSEIKRTVFRNAKAVGIGAVIKGVFGTIAKRFGAKK